MIANPKCLKEELPNNIDAPDNTYGLRNVFLMRHGEAGHNRNKLTGGMDTSLTDFGQEQVLIAAEPLKWLGITDIISSDMLRCRQTAEIVQNSLREDGQEVNVHYSAHLRERKMGIFAGKRNAPDGIPVEDLPDDFYQDPNKYRAETRQDVFRRACIIGKQLILGNARGELGDNVLLIGHGMINDMLLYYLHKGANAEFNMDEFLTIAGRQDNASILRVDIKKAMTLEADGKAQLARGEIIHGNPNHRSNFVKKEIAERNSSG